MIRQNHTIKRFSLELQTDGREQLYNLQRKCIKMVNENLAEGIDEILSNHFVTDEIVRINKIEIDLGNITMAALETDFVTKCIAELSAKINAMPVIAAQQETGEITIVDKEENAIEQFFYFLSTGKMLWTFSNISFEQWQKSITSAIKNKAYLFKNEFSKLLAKDPPVMQRLLLQFDDDFIAVLVELYQPGLKNEYVRLAALLKEQIFTTDNAVVRKTLLATLLPAVFFNLSVIKKDTLPQLIEWINKLPVKNDDEGKLIAIEKAIVVIAEKMANIFSVSPEIKTRGQEPENNISELKAGEVGKENLKETDSTDTSIFINNAGIIILHPFLKNIFTSLGLMEKDEFKDDFCSQKAVHLLQYLGYHEKEAPEYVQQLNKILCGLNDSEHIDRLIQLSEFEIKEADDLLKAVITHWTILKNTSAEALQQTFFQRSGKLTFNEIDNYWKLQVEKSAVDILMDKIPWGISYIQLPWMKYALVTEW